VSFAEQILLDFGAIHAQVSTVDKIPLEYWETLLHCLSDAGQIQTDKQIPIVCNVMNGQIILYYSNCTVFFKVGKSSKESIG
jgi:hypothetical protein